MSFFFTSGLHGLVTARHIMLIFISLQVEILQLENALNAARSRLGEMRKISYQEE